MRNQKKIPTPKTEVGKNQTNNLKLIGGFVFAYADCWFSHEAAHVNDDLTNTTIDIMKLCSKHVFNADAYRL